MIQSVHCAATTAEGKPCRAWAMHGHTLCRSHRDDELGPRGAGAPRGNQNRFVHGFYSRHFTPEERASLDDLGSDVSLTAGIAVARIALRRVLAAFESVQDVPPDQASATSQTPRAVCGGSKIPPALRGTAEAPPSVSGVEDPDLDLQVGTANEAPE
jgi:hypothetical protein